jgi:hypothetical protein
MLSSSVFTLSDTTPTLIVSKSVNPQEVTLHNMNKSSNRYIHIGPSTVTTANSIHIDPGETLTINLAPNDDLWAVSDPDGLVVGVLAVRTL